MYDEMLMALLNLAAGTGVSIFVGSMPPDNGVAMTAQGGVNEIALDNGGRGVLTVTLNGKNANQQTVISTLNSIHARLTRRQDFPSGADWQIYSVKTISSPRLIGREANSQWLYGSSLTVNFSERGI